jgi:hypothetical protein
MTLQRFFLTLSSIASVVLFSGCDNDEPTRENTPELITHVTLTFIPVGGGANVVVNANDPDGEGVQDLEIDGPINLSSGKTYSLSISMINGLVDAGSPGHDLTSEIVAEADEHIIYFSWTNNVFSDPTGNGNIDNRGDDVNYLDDDGSGLPLGVFTSWTAGPVSSGSFRVLLKHQPETKSATSASTDGETDLDITFPINIL